MASETGSMGWVWVGNRRICEELSGEDGGASNGSCEAQKGMRREEHGDRREEQKGFLRAKGQGSVRAEGEEIGGGSVWRTYPSPPVDTTPSHPHGNTHFPQ